ncbi:guanine deaminase [Bimuria novae-zelandiae CBS 107.79]|uniref:Guanine deaminase n=1 Tax=Bimuria novae-zelandiae CBS 107.79 TaxID=1447943 RepID=A0A6A5VUS0_9PLEO|nr:guanine deaminase [Bimuria novae-zelandiae CBS 107.79]
MAASVPISKTIYLGAFAHCISLANLEICARGAIGVDEQGLIQFVEKEISSPSDVTTKHPSWASAQIVSVDDGFFFPGFIDTHTHAPQHPNTGLFGKTTLLDWLETYTFPLEASFEDTRKAGRIYGNFVARTLSHGTTTCAYYATRHVEATNLLTEICLERGQRALVGRVCMDRLSPEYYRDADIESAIRDSKACIDYARKVDEKGEIVRPVVTPRFAPSCTAPCLAELGKLAREEGAFVQTHISENTGECELVKEWFPESESYTHVYDEAALLTERTILAHAIHLSKEERRLIKERGSKISHCPASNTALTSGCCPVRELLDEGITVGLGTDVSGGVSPSILEEARHAIWTSRFVAMSAPSAPVATLNNAAKLSTAEALYLATRGGAAVVGLEEKIGGFDVGKEFDAQMIRLGSVPEAGDYEGTFGDEGAGGPVDIFGFESPEEKVEKWVYSGDDRNCAAVWVRGRLVHKTARYKV